MPRTTPNLAHEQLADAFAIADRAVVADIESEGVPFRFDPAAPAWYDTRPLLDQRERPPELVDMARQGLAYAYTRQLIQQHPVHKHLVRIIRHPA